jgi:hypothetical protein
MADLEVTRLLPNPAGKDRTPANQVTNAQLNGEWVEFRNTTAKTLNIEGVYITHRTFTSRCEPIQDERLTTFKGNLSSGHSVRLHSGSGTDGTDPYDPTLHHVYVGRGNFVWNNVCGDRAGLYVASGVEIDYAYYDRNPPEGVILERVPGSHRLAVPVPAYTRR